MAKKSVKSSIRDLSELILAKKISLSDAVELLRRVTIATGLHRNYGSPDRVAPIIGLSRAALYSYKRRNFEGITFPKKPRDNGVRLDNHKPISDADFPMTGVRETELDAT